MKILEKQSSVLTNWEVLQIVREQQAEHSGSDGNGRARTMPSNLKRILTDVETQLTAKSSPLSGPNRYRNATLKRLFEATRAADFALEKPEYLMIFNLRPKSLAELDTIMEELDSRYGEERQEELLGIIRECLGPLAEGEEEPPVDEEGEGTDWRQDAARKGVVVVEGEGMDVEEE